MKCLFPAVLLLSLGISQDDSLALLRRQAQEALRDGKIDRVVEIVRFAGQIDSVEAAEFALNIVQKSKFDPVVAAGAYEAIREMTSEEVREYVLEEARGNKDWRLRVILLEVVAPMGGERAFQILVKSLEDREELIQAAAVQGLVRRKDSRAIEPIIALMMRLDKKRGLAWEHCQGALIQMTGQQLEMGIDFDTWWRAHGRERAGPSPGPDPQEPPEPVEGRQDPHATFFGLKITCQKVVFIIDVSGSMKTRDPYPEVTRERGGPPREPGEDRMRILRAQKELIKVIDKVHPSVEFNIIAYSDLTTPWSDMGLRKATKSNKESAKKFVRKFQADGTTWTDEALREAYTVNADAHCFYLLSDGTPTHEGGEEPGDTQAIIEHIYAMIPSLDLYRRVRIHTLGFRGANVEFMESLADMTGGTYRDIR